jgi:AcrR family transcriptional regulator
MLSAAIETASGPRRRPTKGGYARGEETRERIIKAAFLVFGEDGYVGASTRRIAEAAGVSPPALQYYFDSKEGLHRACGQAIIDSVASRMTDHLARIRSALTATEPATAIEATCDLVVNLAGLAMERSAPEGWRSFMRRCQTDDAGPAFHMIHEHVTTPLRSTVIDLMAKVRGESADHPEVRLRALLLLSELSAIHAHRDGTLATIGWEDFGGARASVAAEVLKDHVRRIMGPSRRPINDNGHIKVGPTNHRL